MCAYRKKGGSGKRKEKKKNLLTEWDRLCVGVNHWRHHRVDAVAIVVVVR